MFQVFQVFQGQHQLMVKQWRGTPLTTTRKLTDKNNTTHTHANWFVYIR